MDIPEVKKRVVEDELKIGERTFKLRAFDPLLGNYILTKLLTAVLPMGLGKFLKKELDAEVIPLAETPSTPMMSKKEFLELQRDILSHCDEILDAGPSPVVRENGTYGIQNFTMAISLQLLIASIAFNFSGFFEEGQSLLASLLDLEDLDLFPANTKT